MKSATLSLTLLSLMLTLAAAPAEAQETYPFALEGAGSLNGLLLAIEEPALFKTAAAARLPDVAALPVRASQNPSDCGGGTDEAWIQRTLEAASLLSSAAEANKHIEACYNKAKDRLDWAQVQSLLTGLRRMSSYNENDEISTQNRITASFLELKAGQLSAEIAVQIAAKQSSTFQTNQLIEKYYLAREDALSWTEVKVLLAGLRVCASYNAYDEDRVQDRIAASFLESKMSQIDPETAVEIARKQASVYDTNRMIEQYYLGRKAALDFEKVKVLLAGLRVTSSYNHYDEDQTKDRIIKDWACK